MKKSLSLFSANLLFFVTMFLVLVIGSIVQSLDLSWGLVATEVFLIGLPTILFLRARKVPLREGLRLNPIRPGVAVLSLLLGIVTYLFSGYIDMLITQLTGMLSVPIPESMLPSNPLEFGVYFVALAVAAPIFEEIEFRGAIQGAYENHRSASFAVVMTTALFVFYHMRLTGLPSLIPVALILSFVAWRTRSIFGTILIHLGMNGVSGVITILALSGRPSLPPLTFPLVLLSVLIAVILLYAINRLGPAPSLLREEGEVPIPSPEHVYPEHKPSRLKLYWPLAGGGVLYTFVAVLTLYTGLHPELTAPSQLSYQPPRIDHVIESRYQIVNRAGTVVGELDCQVTPQGQTFSLDCTRNQEAYEIRVGQSYFKDGTHTTVWHAVWDGQTLALLEYTADQTAVEGHSYHVTYTQNQGKASFQVTGTDLQGSADLPAGGLMDLEWPWRIASLNVSSSLVYKVSYGYLGKWDAQQQKSLPTITTELLRISPQANLTLPAGKFSTWKVSLAGQEVWYGSSDSGAPRPIQMDDGMVMYQLLP